MAEFELSPLNINFENLTVELIIEILNKPATGGDLNFVRINKARNFLSLWPQTVEIIVKIRSKA